MLSVLHYAVKSNFNLFLSAHLPSMEQAVHQTLINEIETLLAEPKGIDETVAKTYRKSAEALILEHGSHPLKVNLTTCLEQLRERIHTQVKNRDADYERVMAELKKAAAALKDEKLKAAEDSTQKALSIAGQIPGLSAKRRADIDRQLDKIYPRMRKLSAWRHWGTTQARENLIDQIKQIHGSRMDPNKIVKTLRDAKAQWQDWEKSGDHSEHKLWKEFSDACDTAYEPCRVFFKAQKEERKNHLAQKRELIEEINTRFEKTDWAQPDWKDIDKWLRQIRGKFFKIGHTDYKHHKKLKANLDKALDQFETHLSRERERSLKMRQKLIDDILALDQVEDIRAAISELDQLKKKWIVTVLDKRGVENKLWDQYQKAQNVIYDKRNAERKEQDQVRNENLKQKRLVVEGLTKAAGATADELIAGQSALAQHKDQFDEIGYVPRSAEKALMDSWRKAQKRYSEVLDKARKTNAKNAQHIFIEKAKFCAALEQRRQQGDSINVDESIKAYDAQPALSAELESKLRKRLQVALSEQGFTNSDLDAQTETQLARCLKAEVILDLPTPDEYSKQRMAYKIERLSASMKKNNQAQENLEILKLRLLTTGAIHQKQFDTIWTRIDNILKI